MAIPPLIRRILLLTGITALILGVMAVGVRLAAGSAPGRWLVASQLDGREIPGAGRLNLSGLSGDPLASLHVDRITLSDDEGIWLTAEDVTLDWQARSLLARPIHVRNLRAAAITIARRPVLAEPPPSTQQAGAPGLPTVPAIDLEQARIVRLSLAEGLAGPAADLFLEARARLRPRSSHIALEASRLDAPGDALSATFDLADGQVSGALSATGTADGMLAALLRMSGHTVRIDGRVDGDLDTGSGQLMLAAGDQRWAEAGLAWTQAGWQLDGDIALANWGLLPDPLAAEVATVQLIAEGPRGETVTINSVTAETRGSRVVLHHVTDPVIEAEYDFSPTLIERLSQGSVSADHVSGRARIERGARLAIRLQPEITGLAAAGFAASHLSGTVEVSLPDNRPRLALDVRLTGLVSGQTEIDRLVGDGLSVSGVARHAGGEIGWQLDPGFAVSADTLLITGEAALAPRRTWPTARAELALNDVGLLVDQLSGPVTARLALDADRRLDLRLDASSAIWPERAQGLLDGLTAELEASPTGDTWAIDRLHAHSPALNLSLSGHVRDARDWQAGGDLALSGALPVAAIELEGGLATAFRLVRDAEALRIRAVTTTQRLELGPVALDAPRLGLRGRLGEADAPTELEWVFTADRADAGQVALDGHLSAASGTTELTLTTGQIGDTRLDGVARLAGGQLDVTLNAVREALMSLTAHYAGPVADPLAGTVEAALTLEAQRLGAADLNAAGLTLDGPLSALALTAHADGRMRSNIDLSATGEVAITADGVAIAISPSGKWAAHNWNTIEPIRFATSPDGVTAFAAFTLGGGRLDLDLQTAGVSPIATLTIDQLPVAVLADITAMPATQGMVSGEADLRERDGIWRGAARLEATGLLAGDLPDMPELDLVATASLEEEARASLRLTGGGLDIRGEINRAGPTTDIARPQGDAETPISGTLSANGDLLGLAALLLPSDILLEGGRIDSELTISGRVGAPRLNGTAALRDGRVNAATAGSLITDIELDVSLTERSAELTRLSASDNREGHLSGGGRVELADDAPPTGSGRFTFTRFVAVRRPELTLQASGHVDLALDQDGLLVSGESRIDQLRTQPTVNGAASIPQLQVTEINLPKDRRAANETRIPIRLDYRVRADNGLYVSSRAFTSEWGVDLHVTGPEAKPSLTGTASLVGGSAFVFNRRFTLADGGVTFDGAPSDARVDLTAVHSRTGFRATARVQGSVQSPSITLSSEPALPEDEILARLLFDQSVNELGAFEAAQLAAQLSGQSLLDVVGQLRDLAGIDRLDISTNEAGELSVVGGRRFGDNVYVEVGSTGAAAINEALIEWSLTPDLSVLSRVSADTDASVAIRWRRDY